MSEEQLKAFIEKVKGDTSLEEKLKAESADVVAIAKAAGFSISTEDLITYRQNLSDDELESVAGGGFAKTPTYGTSYYNLLCKPDPISCPPSSSPIV